MVRCSPGTWLRCTVLVTACVLYCSDTAVLLHEVANEVLTTYAVFHRMYTRYAVHSCGAVYTVCARTGHLLAICRFPSMAVTHMHASLIVESKGQKLQTVPRVFRISPPRELGPTGRDVLWGRAPSCITQASRTPDMQR